MNGLSGLRNGWGGLALPHLSSKAARNVFRRSNSSGTPTTMLPVLAESRRLIDGQTYHEQPPSKVDRDSLMTPEELKHFDEWIKRVQDGLEERKAPPALRERVKENHEKLRAYLQQQNKRQAESLKWLTEGEGRPTFLAFVDKELKRLEGLNNPPDHKKALKEHLESLKTDNPTPFPFPKPRPGRFGSTIRKPN
jgi:hypothetical protein